MSRTTRRGIRLLLRFYRDQRGGEVLEYSLVAGLLVVGCVSAISCVGTKALARWNSISSSL